MKGQILSIVLLLPCLLSGGESLDKIVIDDDLSRTPRFLQQDFAYSHAILDWQENVTNKPLKILEFGAEGVPAAPGLLVSGAFWGNYLHETTDTAGKFPILSRFPDERRNRTNSGDRWLVSNAAIALTARPVSWFTGYAQYEFTEVEFPGQEDWQFRRIFGMIGDLDRSPFYAYFGRNVVDFGWLDGYNPFTHTVNNHFFRTDSDDPVIGIGYAKGGLHIAGTLIPSGRHLRVADTEETNGWDNGAINASYTFGDRDESGRELRIGGGYLHSTIYNNDVPHHPGPSFALSRQLSPDLVRNGAWDIFAEYVHGPLRVGAEHTATTDAWPATGERVRATNFQAAWDFALFDRPTTLSAVYGIGRQGPDGSEFAELTQLAIGIETAITPFFSLTAEWVRNESFAPLINIRTASDADVTADAVLVGAKIQF